MTPTQSPQEGQAAATPAALAELALPAEVVLVLVDAQGRIVDVRCVPPDYLAANLVAEAHTHPTEGDPTCADVGRCPWPSD